MCLLFLTSWRISWIHQSSLSLSCWYLHLYLISLSGNTHTFIAIAYISVICSAANGNRSIAILAGWFELDLAGWILCQTLLENCMAVSLLQRMNRKKNAWVLARENLSTAISLPVYPICVITIFSNWIMFCLSEINRIHFHHFTDNPSWFGRPERIDYRRSHL